MLNVPLAPVTATPGVPASATVPRVKVPPAASSTGTVPTMLTVPSAPATDTACFAGNAATFTVPSAPASETACFAGKLLIAAVPVTETGSGLLGPICTGRVPASEYPNFMIW